MSAAHIHREKSVQIRPTILTAICLATTMPVIHAQETTQGTYLGDITFQNQTISRPSAEMLHRQMQLSRTSELVVWSMPIANFYQAFKACQTNLKVSDSDLAIGLYLGPDAVRMFLTANVTTPYTVTFFDLSRTGPAVFEIPEGGVYGVSNNAWQQPIKEINSGKAEKLLIVGPGQDFPQDFDGEIIQSDTFVNFLFYRVLGTGPEAEKLKRAVKAYKLTDASENPETMFVAFTPSPDDAIAYNTPPSDMGYWELINEMVQREPMADRDRFFYAWLKDLGIEKGKPFDPTDEQKEILLEGLKVGLAMAQTNSFNTDLPAAVYQNKESGWEFLLAGMDPKIDMDTYSMYSERAAYSYEATSTSAGMLSQVEGKGSGYLASYYDSDGNALMGGNNYRLKIEPNPPAANFWSITVYDIEKRVVLRNKTGIMDISSRTEGLEANDDGSIDLYFGPTAPAGKESNWIQTNLGESWFTYFRVYGPLKPFFEESYQMNKMEKR